MLRYLLLVVAGAVVLMGFSFYNGYPLLYPDTSTYLASGFELESPMDRPITYGLFLRAFSAGFSLWLVALVQCLILSALLLAMVKLVFKKRVSSSFLIIVTTLGSMTVLPFVAGQIITDIFPGIALISMILLLFQKMSRAWVITLCFTYFLAIAMHMSHVLIFGAVLFILLMLHRRIARKNIHMNLGMVIALLFLTAASIVTMGAAVAKSKHVFFMGRLVENGILKSYLQEHCPDETIRLCCCIETLPSNTTNFLWGVGSPLYTEFDSWADSKSEFNTIINGTFTSPKYLGMHAKEAARSSGRQLISFKAGDGYGPTKDYGPLYERLIKYFPNDKNALDSSRQSQSLFLPSNLENLNLFYSIIVIVALSILLAGFLFKALRQYWSNSFKLVIIIFAMTYCINCIVNASLVIVADRFGAKLIWIFPLLAAIAVIQWVSARKNTILHS